MSSKSDRIKPTDKAIGTFLDGLKNSAYQIPTFQRNVVWAEDNVKKLWDSICRFYPIGSLLVWLTDTKLHRHRALGGWVLGDGDERREYQYILDGQQRTTALLTSLYGGKIEGRADFDPALYVDLSVEDTDDPDESLYRERFLFWNEIDDRGGELTRNKGRMQRYRKGLVVSLEDIFSDYQNVEGRLHDAGYSAYDDPVRSRLRDIKDVLDNYRLSFIELRGIAVPEVCTIFERINQEGEPLDIFDIVVAKTFRPKESEKGEFYLRKLCDDFTESIGSEFSRVRNHDLLQATALIIRGELPEAGIKNITETYLTKLQAEHIEKVWSGVKEALTKTFDFFHNTLHLPGPELVPLRYLYMTLANYFYENEAPDYGLLKKYFWYYCFYYENRLRNTTHLREHADALKAARDGHGYGFDRFVIDRAALRRSKYSSRGRLSSAILALLANREPCDWEDPDRKVLNEVYYMLTDKPNLHHVFARKFMQEDSHDNQVDVNSLMNIVYLPQITNLQIGARNPCDYVKNFVQNQNFAEVSEAHLLPEELFNWVREDRLPPDALDQFVEKRIDLFIDVLQNKLDGIEFTVIDTSKQEEPFEPDED
ncbi:MAG: GmrSD restriction endonuclease domain-containing protein [Planctomycetota bacterium]